MHEKNKATFTTSSPAKNGTRIRQRLRLGALFRKFNGRLHVPDDFTKDTCVADPQSW